VNRTL